MRWEPRYPVGAALRSGSGAVRRDRASAATRQSGSHFAAVAPALPERLHGGTSGSHCAGSGHAIKGGLPVRRVSPATHFRDLFLAHQHSHA